MNILRRTGRPGGGLLALALVAIAPALVGQVGTVRVAAGLSSPTYLTHAPGDSTRLFVTERYGDIEILDAQTGQLNGTPFLSITSATDEGLQGLAFHPDYASNGYFFVHYYADARSNLVRYTATTADLADPGSAHTVLTIDQPRTNHNGGWIGFGPDGYLYMPVGDGGKQHDPDGNGQTIVGELLSSVLRLDVDGDDFPADPDRNYSIPPDNPFVGITGEDEIWAYGLRNPFRSSFDRLTGDFYIADVGQASREEVNFQPASSTGGENYGWHLREGTVSTPTGSFGGPQPPGGVDPIYDYTHGPGTNEGESITGGYVYRGPVTSLRGQYFFADYDRDRIWSIEHDGQSATQFRDWTDEFVPEQGAIDAIVGFGEDAPGNVYIVDLDGEVFRIVGPTGPVAIPALGGGLAATLALLVSVGGCLALRRRSRTAPAGVA